MPEKQITEKQHYIPQVYLKGFSQDGISIYEYYIKKAGPIPHAVPIESVCREKYLYEVRDKSGEIIGINYIENALCAVEGLFAEHRRLIERKALKANYNCRCFLSTEEKEFWYFYIALQILRNPLILSEAKAIVQDSFPEQFTSNSLNNIALAYCLPFFPADEKRPNAFMAILSMLLSKKLSVGIADNDSFFTSDIAVYGYAPEGLPAFEYLWFPISSSLVIMLSDPKQIDRSQYNRLIPVSAEKVNEVNKGIAYNANQMILSKYPFTDTDIKLIEDVRNDKAHDEAFM